jgi:hypothetical protein
MRKLNSSHFVTRFLLHGAASAGFVASVAAGPSAWAASDNEVLEESRIYIEYNSTDNDLGFHIFLDGEDWKKLRIVGPHGRMIFDVAGKSGYGKLGLTELFTEGAEPSLYEMPLEELLSLFPEGTYQFEGMLADGGKISGTGRLTHAVPAGPDVSCTGDVVGSVLNICWQPVDEKATDPAGGVFPDRTINVVAYQVIVGSFQVTVPASDSQMTVTVPPQYVDSLEPGEHGFEVLAIEAGGNQTIAAGTVNK